MTEQASETLGAHLDELQSIIESMNTIAGSDGNDQLNEVTTNLRHAHQLLTAVSRRPRERTDS